MAAIVESVEISRRPEAVFSYVTRTPPACRSGGRATPRTQGERRAGHGWLADGGDSSGSAVRSGMMTRWS